MTKAVGINRILILDDDMDFRKLLKTILAKYLPDTEFHEYDPVAEGAPADDFDWSRYDVLVLDYYLCVHRLTGLDLLQKHRKRTGFPAAIMLTGAGSEEIAVRAMNFGVYEYLRKDKLDKALLAAAIVNAHKKHGLERIKQNGLEKARNIFDKSLFYKQLERSEATGQISTARVFLLIDIDAYPSLAATLGPIGSDNLGRFVAQIVYQQPGIKQGNPCITRLSESAVGVLADSLDTNRPLNSVLKEMCLRLGESPYQSGENFIPYTVSIGAVCLGSNNIAVETLFKQANQARDIARAVIGNSFHLYTGKESPGEVKRAIENNASASVKELSPSISVPQTVTEDLPVQPSESEQTSSALPLPEESTEPDEPEIRSVMDIPLELDDDTGPGRDELSAAKMEPPEATASGDIESATSAGSQEEQMKPEGETGDEIADEPVLEMELPEDTAAGASVSSAAIESEEQQKSPGAETDDELVINEADLDEYSLKIKRAFDDNRSVQTFQPVIAMVTSDTMDLSELFKVDLQMVDLDGKITGARELRAHLNSLPLQQFIDRWMLRQLIGRTIRVVKKTEKKRYLLTISEAWFSDIGLFGWLKLLLSGLEIVKPGRFITLEISADIFSRYQERVMILIKTLKKTYGFKIALGTINNADEAIKISKLVKFDLIMVDSGLLAQTKGAAGNGEKAMNLLNSLKSPGTQIIFDGVENATILTDVISAGADYVMGNFIGEPQTSLNGTSNVVSFNIS